MCLIKVDFSLLLFPFGWHLLDFMTLGDVQNITWTWKRSTQQHATINVSLESQCQILPCKVLIRISHSQIKSLRTNNTLLHVRDCHIGKFTFRVPIRYYFEEYIGLRTKFAPHYLDLYIYTKKCVNSRQISQNWPKKPKFCITYAKK